MRDKYFVNVNKTANTEKYNEIICYNFVIHNKGCNINGYHENWIMKCQKCINKRQYLIELKHYRNKTTKQGR